MVNSKPNGALSSGEKVPATPSPLEPSSATVKPTTWKSPANLFLVVIPLKTLTKHKVKAKELEPEFSPLSPVEAGRLTSPL